MVIIIQLANRILSSIKNKSWLLFFLLIGSVFAQNQLNVPYFDFGLRPSGNNQEVALSIQILLILTVLTIAPSIIIMMTSFIRVVIILKFTQRALSLQSEPPNNVIMGLALFITFFVMSPTIKQIYEESYIPYSKQAISTDKFIQTGMEPLKDFMIQQTRERDLSLFRYLAKKDQPRNKDDIGMIELIPAFIISELTTAFKIGIYLFIPFIVIDMIVASILMAMGMIMLPPVMISLPFKIILFVLVDGWHLLTLQMVKSFNF